MVKEASSSSIKKKRKTTSAENETEPDIYKLWNLKKKSPHSVRVHLMRIYTLKCARILRKCWVKFLKGKSKKSVDATLNRDLLTEICVKLCIIKKLNRIDKIKHVFGKETLSTEKQKCDSIKLSYQNLVYELHHLVAETNKCLAFKSKDEDIELVTFEEFMKEAPESLSKKFTEYNEENTEQRHSLRLSRLEWELTQRKSLAELCKSLIEEQKKLGQDLVERRDKLNTLRPLLMSIINATKPLQEHLDVSFDQLRDEHKLAFLLPDPLYIFYVNIVSYKNVYGSGGGQKRRHRKSVQQVDPMEEKKKKLLEVHPLSVEITAMVENGPSLIATFRYYTKLKIVTVTSKVNMPANITANTAREILSGENILGELMEGDFGVESPNPTTPYQLKKIGVNSYQFLVPQIGYAYNWAQGVCGMDFLTKQKACCDKIGSSNVENVVKILFKRLVVRNDLANQLQQLEQNILPKLPSTVNLPSSPVSSLTKWSSITYQKFCQSEFTQALVEEELVSPSDLFYSTTLNRGNANMQALIVIKDNYPDTPPMFSLCLNYNGVFHSGNSDEIRCKKQKKTLQIQESRNWYLHPILEHVKKFENTS
ncbi:hypothetical protein NQ314_014620 [Rhamnusium bicolor]|uniref:Uncharacterized protein n=1 Tax=Rhamnusium bicolor TaxID=1586634 RepID=A0AAV8X0S6_9CUCU|nr:hypothetical protein NQ314_014620 [Rhamnusium bicolor]